MPPESPSSSLNSSVRTIDDIGRERGESYPQKHRDTIRNNKDRSDFLVAGYNMIISPPRKKEIFSRLLLAGSFSNRKMMIDLIKGKDRQLGLMGIFKKIISFDYGSDVLALTDDELLKILREMQALFEPETIQKITRPTPPAVTVSSLPAPEEDNSRQFMGRKITNTFILAVLDNLLVQAPPAPEPISEAKIVTPSPMPAPVSSVAQPVAAKVHHALQQTRRPVLPPAPRRGEKPQQLGHRVWVVPARVRQELQRKAAEKEPEVAPRPPEAPYTGPIFTSLDKAIVWLREQAQWEKFYPQAISAQDDLALMSFLRSNAPQLLPILLAIKQKFGCKTQREILREVLHPSPKIEPVPVCPTPPISVVPKPIEPGVIVPTDPNVAPKMAAPIIPVAPISPQDKCLEYIISLEVNQSGMQTLRGIASAYQEGRLAEAWSMYETFEQEEENELNGGIIDAWDTLCDLKIAKKELGITISILGLILEVCGYEFEEDPLFDYKIEYVWEERVGEYLVAAGITPEALVELLEIRDKIALADELKKVVIKIPLGMKKWLQWQEKVALETNLWQFLEELLELNHKGQKIKAGFDIHDYKKLMRHIQFPDPETE